LFLVLAGCSAMNTAGLTACGGENSCGWISPQGRPVSDHPDLGSIKDGYSQADMYYYSGTRALPTAVIKLNREYAIDDVSWKSITDPEMFIEIVQNMKKKGEGNTVSNLQAFAIKAHDARPIGVWYSDKYVYGVRVSFAADRNVYAKASENNDQSSKVIYVKNRSDNFIAQGSSICLRCHGAA